MANEGLLLLNLTCLSLKKAHELVSFLVDPQKIFKITRGDLEAIPSLQEKDKREILNLRQSGILEKELQRIKKEGIEIIGLNDSEYPEFLKEIAYPPLVLYVKGERAQLKTFLFAIVGTRIPTLYGLLSAEDFAYKLSSLGLGIVSGLARGIDTAAHKGALKAGRTVAVLGSGLCNIYPKENIALAAEIIKKGVVVSEFPLATPPRKENFPRRNRIISGLAKGVLVIEAGLRSGALITATCALEQNREVFAIPGKIDSPLSRGTHKLIKEGAKLVEGIEDIMEELNIRLERKGDAPCVIKLLPEEQRVFDTLGSNGLHLEELLIKSKTDLSQLNRIILNLQLKGLIKEARPAYFVRTYHG